MNEDPIKSFRCEGKHTVSVQWMTRNRDGSKHSHGSRCLAQYHLGLRLKVGRELERLFEEKVIKPAQFSERAAPIVPAVKPNGFVRMCVDYKVTVH